MVPSGRAPRKLAEFAVLWVVCGSVFGALAAADQRICPHVLLVGKEIPGFSDTELRLVCGEPKGAEKGREGWVSIPPWQAKFNLRNFLQQKGFLHPVFHQRGEDLRVELNQPTDVTSLSAEGAPRGLKLARRRKVLGERLTPDFLDDLEKWTTRQLKTLGYACPTVKADADSDTGAVKLIVKSGPRQNLVAIRAQRIDGNTPGFLRRYDAFELGKPYNEDLLALTTNRVTSVGVLESLHFRASCEPGGVVVQEDALAGAPRLLVFGFGINTEGVILGKASWKNTRLGDHASLLDVTASASAIEQRLDATAKWYVASDHPRIAFNPLVQILHQNELYFETLTQTTRLAGATSWDGQSWGLNGWIGPEMDLTRTFRGVGPSDSRFLSLVGSVGLMSHDFEFFANSPRSGMLVRLTGRLNTQSIFSDVSAQGIDLGYEALWNFRDYDPPLWVFGLRMGLSSTLSDARPGVGTPLPPTYLQFLGGSANLRGFGRNELPTDGFGSMTSLFTDFELRLSNTLPMGFEPFGFVDLGALGNAPLSLDLPVFWSPGLGLRWASPFGVFRMTLAHGFPENTPGHWQFNFSFGEEF